MRNHHLILLSLSMAAHGHVVRQVVAEAPRPTGPEALETVGFYIPNGEEAFTTTIPACDSVSAFVMQAIPTGTLSKAPFKAPYGSASIVPLPLINKLTS